MENQSCLACDYFLERHINVDGCEGGLLAMAETLLESLCEQSKRKREEAKLAALSAILLKLSFGLIFKKFWIQGHLA